ncbi:50S ribosomal protein L21 [Candidatus Peregrinibacteria bacterium]|nr:MAG: 50S ribosomal protein L21 [Candidatus Peregrinibacteria bacterium]
MIEFAGLKFKEFIMYAIIEDGAHQYKIEKGEILCLESKDIEEGKKFEIKQVLLVMDDKKTEIGAPFVSYTVELKVLRHFRGDKLRIFKKKAKKRYERVQGHRQNYTEVEVLSIKASK